MSCESRGWKLHLAVSSHATGDNLPTPASLSSAGWLLIKCFPIFTYPTEGLPLLILSLILSGFKWVLPAPALVLVYIVWSHPLTYHSSSLYQLVILYQIPQLQCVGKNSKQFQTVTAVSTTILCQHSSRPQASLVSPVFPDLRRLSWGQAALLSLQGHAFIPDLLSWNKNELCLSLLSSVPVERRWFIF